MKLLQNSVLIPIPAFQVGGEDGNIDVNFSILFKRQTTAERKKRQKSLRKRLALITKQQQVMSEITDDDELLESVQAKMDELDDLADKLLFDDIIGWRDLNEDDGTEIPYSVKDKKAILNHDGFREAILNVWNLSSGNIKPEVVAEADSKN